MIEDVRLAVGDSQKIEHFGRVGGYYSPEEVLNALETLIIGG